MAPKTPKSTTPKSTGATSARARRTADAATPSGRNPRAAATEPAKPGRVAAMKQAYGFAKQVDPKITWWIVGAALTVFLVCLLLGKLIGPMWLWTVIGIPLAALAATVVMSRRTDAGAYSMIEGKPGAALAALTSITRGGWYVQQEPVAVEGRPQGQDFSNVATVYRAVGRPGVVLVGEGPAARTKKLMLAEQKKVERLAPGAPVTLFRVGEGEDTVPVRKLSWTMQKLKPVLTKDEVAVVNKRLKAMTGIRPAVPAGMDPSRVRPTRPR